MQLLAISDREEMVFALQDEIRRGSEARYNHRLHAVLLVAQGMSCREAAETLGESPRTVETWVHRFEEIGFAGLNDGARTGQRSRLTAKDRAGVKEALGHSPVDYGFPDRQWNGPLLSALLKEQFGVMISTRSSQRLIRESSIHLHKARPIVVQTPR